MHIYCQVHPQAQFLVEGQAVAKTTIKVGDRNGKVKMVVAADS
jgi:hypothetical protein